MVVSEHFLFPFSNLAVFSCHARHFSPDVLLCFSSNVANPWHFELFPYGNLLDYKRRSFVPLSLFFFLSRTEKSYNTLVTAYTHCHLCTLHLVLNFMCFIPLFSVILLYGRSWTTRLELSKFGSCWAQEKMSVLCGFRNVDVILKKAGISAKSGLNTRIVNSITRNFRETHFIIRQSSAAKLSLLSSFLATILYVLLLRRAFRLVNYLTDIIGRM